MNTTPPPRDREQRRRRQPPPERITAAHWVGFFAVVLPMALWAAHQHLDPCHYPDHPRAAELCL